MGGVVAGLQELGGAADAAEVLRAGEGFAVADVLFRGCHQSEGDFDGVSPATVSLG